MRYDVNKNEYSTVDLIIPKGAEELMKRLHSAGHTVYVVGGCVRDTLLGRTPHDWDLCTSATPDEMLQIFADHRVIETGLKHGTITVMCEDEAYEITTYRTDGQYSDGRHPDSVDFVKDVKEDLARRDFTINAMAYYHDSLFMDFQDPFHGQSDLKAKLIRTVGNPVDRFTEDGLRILRALRFASVYDFQIEFATSQAIHVLRPLLQKISVERIRVELSKLLAGKAAYRILSEYADVICEIIPELTPCIGFHQNNPYHAYNVYDHICHAVENYWESSEIINMTLLLHDIGKPSCYTETDGVGHFHGHGEVSKYIAEQILDRLKFDNKSKNAILELIYFHDLRIDAKERAVRRVLNKMSSPEQFRNLMIVRRADILAQSEFDQVPRIEKSRTLEKLMNDILEKDQCFQMKDLAINGMDIIHAFEFDPESLDGKQIGRAKNLCLNAVIDEEVENDRSALIAYLKEYPEMWR